MENISLNNIISLITVFICLLLVFFLISAKTEKKLSNRLFALFLIIVGIDYSGWFLGLLTADYPGIDLARGLVGFFQLPLFYLYIISLCYSNFKLQWKHLIHLIPYIVVNLILLPNLYFEDKAIQLAFIEDFLQQPEIQFTHIFIHILVIIYFIAIFYTLNRFKKIYKENYTNTSSITYKWLVQLTVIFAVTHFIILLKNILKFSDYDDFFNVVKMVIRIFWLFVVCWYVLMALNYPKLFKSVDANLKLVGDIINEDDTHTEQKTLVKNEDIEKLKNFMLKEKIFLEPSLTIQELAFKMNLNVKYLSILINHNMGQHFFDFVNGYRIEKAKEILKDISKNKLTVLEILYEVGFNSKSSFNTAFKKYTGMTPTAYRKNNSKTAA